jgi:hypothetical protein
MTDLASFILRCDVFFFTIIKKLSCFLTRLRLAQANYYMGAMTNVEQRMQFYIPDLILYIHFNNTIWSR